MLSKNRLSRFANRWNEKTLSRSIFMLCLFVCTITAFSQNDPLKFRTIDISDGLSHNMINVIYKDQSGFIWLGTQLGLDRFDGIRIKTFEKLANQSIFCICETSPYYLWVGTDKGLFKINLSTEETEKIELSSRNLILKTLYPLSDEYVIVGTNQGIYIISSVSQKHIIFNNDLLSQSNFITGIIRETDSRYWLSSHNGLIQFNPQTDEYQIYLYNKEDKGKNSFSCLAQSDNTIFLGTRNQGIMTFDISTKEVTPFPYTGNQYIKAISTAGKNAIYVSTNGGGIKKIDIHRKEIIESIEHTPDPQTISSNAVYSFLKDKEMYWVGTYMGGVSYTPAKGKIFQTYSMGKLFDSNYYNVRSFHIAEQGVKLIGTRDGFFYISEKENTLRHFSSKNSILRSDIILFIHPYKKGYLIGSYGGGLYIYEPDNNKLNFFNTEDIFSSNSFSGCTTDKSGGLWIATSIGIMFLNPANNSYHFYDTGNSAIKENANYSVMCDSKNRIWAGTSKGITFYDPNTKKFIQDILPAEYLSFTQSVRFIMEDKEKNIWFCDDKEGVLKINESFTQTTHYTTEDFLPSNSVMSIIEDHKGGKWFSTQRGILYAHEEDNKFQFFSLFNGIPGYIFNYPVQQTPDGTIWWGNEQGLVYYVPDKNHDSGSDSTISPVITSISVAGKKLEPGDDLLKVSPQFLKEIRIPYSKNSIELSFSSLTYAPENTEIYEYILEGYEPAWNSIMIGNSASYTNLPAGKYIFKVRTGSAPLQVSSLIVRIKKDYNYTAWITLGLVLACLFGLLYNYSRLLGKYRSIKALRIEKEKYSKSKLTEQEVTAIKNRLIASMENDKSYLNPDLKLQDVATVIGCSVVDLSQVLNSYMQCGFTDFVNTYRIEEFIRKVKDGSAAKYTLSSLSERCGFTSRTSFFRSFKKLKGKTPAEYIKEKGINLKK